MPHPSGEHRGIDVVVIGAGISGLLAGRELGAAGLRVQVFEKARGPGGRMATRRFGDAVFDHGAQYFTARAAVFREMAAAWETEGLIQRWGDGFVDGEGRRDADGEARYMGLQGMTTVPKWLAERLEMHCGVTAEGCAWVDDAWQVTFRERAPVRARALVLTAPIPQSRVLLAAGNTPLPAEVEEGLASIEYAPCLAALIRLVGPSQVPSPGGLRLGSEPIEWLADNTQKGLSPPALGAGVTIHAGPEFSRANWGADPDDIAARLAETARDWLGADISATQVHRWRYARPLTTHAEPCVAVSAPGPLVLVGDAFGGPRVESAALSGLAGAAALRSML